MPVSAHETFFVLYEFVFADGTDKVYHFVFTFCIFSFRRGNAFVFVKQIIVQPAQIVKQAGIKCTEEIMFTYVFFDLDGTLLNTLDDLADAGNYALVQQGFEPYPNERYKYFVGNGIPKFIERILPEGSDDALRARTHELFSEYYGAHSEDNTRPYDGITEMLDELKARGIHSAVITNKDHIYAGELIRKYFGDRIDAVYGSIPGTPHKPDPYWVNKALADFGAAGKDVLYAGDSGVDMQTAKNAGLISAGVLWGFRKEDELRENGAVYICSSPKDIIDLVLTNVTNMR